MKNNSHLIITQVPCTAIVRSFAVFLTACLFVFFPMCSEGGQVLRKNYVLDTVAGMSPAGRLAGTNRLDLAISLPLQNRAALNELLKEINDPASPNYRHYLTPEQFTAQFGPSEADYQALKTFAQAHGLQVSATHPNRMLLDVNGAVADIEQAFHVQMNTYRHPTEGRTFYAPDSVPSVDLATPILDVSGLDNYARPKPLLVAKALTNGTAASPNSGSGLNGTYLGKDFRAAYAPDTAMTGSGQTVGLLQFDGYTASDITYYESLAGLSNVTLSNVLLDGFSGAPSGDGGEVEVSLDIEMSISMAPGLSKVIVYMAGPGGNWHDLLNRMANDNLAKQLSCSWYIPGGGPDPVAEQIFQQMGAQGQTFFAACGDYDAYTGLIPFPCDSTNVVEVGGTFLNTTGPQGAYVSESVWNRGGGIGTGGGISTSYAIPNWQTNISMAANQGSTTHRNIPDVALTADNVYVRADGEDWYVGGTSCAAPLWAGFTALVNQQAVASGRAVVGFIDPALDSIGSGAIYTNALHDITNGNNTSPSSPNKFYAVPGFDLCTGWGTPCGQALITALATPDPLTITPTSGFTAAGASGGPFTVTGQTFTLANVGTNAIIWTALTNASWLNVTPAEGILTSHGSSTPVTVSLNTNAYTLSIGNYTGTVTFSNVTTVFAQTRQFTLQVLPSIPPGIVTQPSNESVYVNFNTSFSVTASGTPPLDYQWQFDSTNIAGATNSVLTLANVSFSQAGSYSVTVSNTFGSTNSTNAILTVNPPPPCDPVPPGLVGWWQAEGNTLDATGVNNGMPEGALTYAPGEVNQAFKMDGSTAYVLCPASSSLNVGLDSGLTIECWIDPGDTNVGRPVVEWYGNPGFGAQLWVSGVNGDGFSPGDLYANIVDTSGTFHILQTPPGILQPNTFQHVAVTYDKASGVCTIYWNGTVVSTAYLGSFTPQTTYNLYLGSRIGVKYFNGLMDEVGIYNRALSASEVQGIYASLFTGKCPLQPMPPVIITQPANETSFEGFSATFNVLASGTAPLLYQWQFDTTNIVGATNSALTLSNLTYAEAGTYSVIISNALGFTNSSNAVLTVNPPPACSPVPAGLVSWWAADGNTLDAEGLNNGVAVGSLPYATGEVGLAFSFSGNAQYVQIPASSSLNLGAGSGLTMECWISPADTNNGRPVIEWFGNPGFGVQLWVSGVNGSGFSPGDLYVNLVDTGGGFHILQTPPNVLSLDTFQHVAVTYDKASGVCNIYRNGALIDSTNFGSLSLQTSYSLYLGARPGVKYYNGLLDEASVYSRALSATEIQNIYVAGSQGKCLGPIITAQPASQSAPTGENVSFSVSAYGTSPLFYQWTFDNTNLTDGGQISGSQTSALTLTGVQLANSGSYAVMISNVDGATMSANALLTVGSAPVITNQPQNVEVMQGSDASFTVGVSGAAPLAYQWYYGGVALPLATNATLTLTNVQLANSGSYNVAVTNIFGAALSSTAVLTVDSPPAILIQPVGVSLYAGLNASFSVTASGSLPLDYQWQFDSTNINGATNSILTLTDVAVSQSGSYTVIVSNAFGSTNSSNAVLTVIPPPPCAPAPSGLVGWWQAEGNTLDSTGVNNGTPEGGLAYAPGEVGQAFNMNGSSTYVLCPASSSLNVGLDSGLTIECWIDPGDTNVGRPVAEWYGDPGFGAQLWVSGVNGNGFSPGDLYVNMVDTSGNFHILQTPPGVLRTNVFQHVAVTYDKSSGVCSIYWNGSVVSTTNLGAFTPQTSYNLYLGSRIGVKYFNGLMDEISVYNRALATTEIQAIYSAGRGGKCPQPPNIVTQPASTAIAEGSTASFSVVASGAQPMAYQWLFDGSNIDNATNSSLVLSNVSFSEAGSYAVVVANEGGATNSFAAILTVIPPPPCMPPPAGLVGWWPGQGNTLDLEGSNNGIAEGNLTYAPGEVGQAFQMDGSTAYVLCPASASLNVGTNSGLTMECWIDPADIGVGRPIVEWYGNPGFGAQLWVAGVNGEGSSPGDLYANIIDTSGNFHILQTSPGVVEANVFQHVAVTYNKSSGVCSIYWNGSIVSTTNFGSFTPQTGYNLYLGSRIGVKYFYGLMDEVSIYNRALSSNEMEGIYAAGVAGKCLAPVVFAQPSNEVTLVGNNASFAVSAYGTGLLSYQWYFNHAVLPGAQSSVLALTNVQTNAAGSYSVLISNAEGTIMSSNAVLTVDYPPIIRGQPVSETVVIGAGITFGVAASGVPAPGYQWFVNGAGISGATARSLTLTNVAPTDGGSYSVIASNSVGIVASSNAVLTVNDITQTVTGQALSLPATNLTVPSHVQPGKTFAVTAVSSTSAQGGTVQLANGMITYTPPAGLVGSDTFNYILTPSSGPSFSGNITVVVSSCLILGATVNGGQATIRFQGVPETTYYIQASTNLVNWTLVGAGTAGPNGMFQFQDPNAGLYQQRYYRTTQSP